MAQPDDLPAALVPGAPDVVDLAGPAPAADVPATALVPLPAPDEPVVDARHPSDVDEWGRSERVRAAVRALVEPVYRHWFRVEWEGLRHVPDTGGALLVANHAGALPVDATVVMHGVETEVGRAVYGMGENLFRALPFAGTFWARAGGIPAHPDNALRLLAAGELVLCFPEGSKGTGKLFSERYRLQRFGRGGFVEIAMRAGVPVIPVAVVGAEEAMPMLWRSTRLGRLLGVPYLPVTANQLLFGPLVGLVAHFPAKFRLRVLPPVRFDAEPGLERYPRGRLLEESERIRASMQQALHEMLAARESVWRG